MAVPNIDHLLALDVETRLMLVQRLWGSLFEDAKASAAMPVSPHERELLEARLKA